MLENDSEQIKFTEEEMEIMNVLNDFYKKLYTEVLNGRPWSFVHELSANMMIHILRNICNQLFIVNNNLDEEECINFIDQICLFAKEEVLKLYKIRSSLN